MSLHRSGGIARGWTGLPPSVTPTTSHFKTRELGGLLYPPFFYSDAHMFSPELPSSLTPISHFGNLSGRWNQNGCFGNLLKGIGGAPSFWQNMLKKIPLFFSHKSTKKREKESAKNDEIIKSKLWSRGPFRTPKRFRFFLAEQ